MANYCTCTPTTRCSYCVRTEYRTCKILAPKCGTKCETPTPSSCLTDSDRIKSLETQVSWLRSMIDRKVNKSFRDPTEFDDNGTGIQPDDIWINQATGKRFINLSNASANSKWAYDMGRDPDRDDDITKCYTNGDYWKNRTTGKLWQLIDNSTGNAVWQLVEAPEATATQAEPRVDTVSSAPNISNFKNDLMVLVNSQDGHLFTKDKFGNVIEFCPNCDPCPDRKNVTIDDRAPTANDDYQNCYRVDDIWLTTDGKAYICRKDDNGNAVWELITSKPPEVQQGEPPVLPADVSKTFNGATNAGTLVASACKTSGTDPVTYTIDDTANFVLDGCDVKLKNGCDGTADKNYTVKVTGTNDFGSDEMVITVKCNKTVVNGEPPVLPADMTVNKKTGELKAGDTIADACKTKGTDPVTYTLSDNVNFELDGCTLKAKTDFCDNEGEKSVTITGTNDFGSDDMIVTVKCTANCVEPKFDAPAMVTVDGSQKAGYEIGTYVPSQGTEPFTYKLNTYTDTYNLDTSGKLTLKVDYDGSENKTDSPSITVSNDCGSDTIEVPINYKKDCIAPNLPDSADVTVDGATDAGTIIYAGEAQIGDAPITYSVDNANYTVDGSGNVKLAVDYDGSADKTEVVNLTATNTCGSDTCKVNVTYKADAVATVAPKINSLHNIHLYGNAHDNYPHRLATQMDFEGDNLKVEILDTECAENLLQINPDGTVDHIGDWNDGYDFWQNIPSCYTDNYYGAWDFYTFKEVTVRISNSLGSDEGNLEIVIGCPSHIFFRATKTGKMKVHASGDDWHSGKTCQVHFMKADSARTYIKDYGTGGDIELDVVAGTSYVLYGNFTKFKEIDHFMDDVNLSANGLRDISDAFNGSDQIQTVKFKAVNEVLNAERTFANTPSMTQIKIYGEAHPNLIKTDMYLNCPVDPIVEDANWGK